MGSWERQESEYQMLALLSAALSNLTLLKTHFTFDRYVTQMLQSFNMGASKVKQLCGNSQQQVRPATSSSASCASTGHG